MSKSELIVLAFKNETDALSMRDTLIRMQKMQLITLHDAAVVIRRQDGKTETKQVTSLTGAGALGGAFWGMLIGLLFWMPWLGLAIGAVSGRWLASSATSVWMTSSSKKLAQRLSQGIRRCSCW